MTDSERLNIILKEFFEATENPMSFTIVRLDSKSITTAKFQTIIRRSIKNILPHRKFRPFTFALSHLNQLSKYSIDHYVRCETAIFDPFQHLIRLDPLPVTFKDHVSTALSLMRSEKDAGRTQGISSLIAAAIVADFIDAGCTCKCVSVVLRFS